MSFARDVKLELGQTMPAAMHCRRAELSGILFGAGVFEIGPGGRYQVRVSLRLPATARHVLGLLKSFGVSAMLRTVSASPLGLRYEVVLGDEPRDLQLLNELGILSDDLRLRMTVPARLVQRHCCLQAFVRGLFLGCGSISAPGSEVHVEFTVEDADFAAQVRGLLERLGLQFKLTARDRNVACYSKRSQTAADLLATMGAHSACLRWEEHVVMGDVRQSANRRANCDAANARRSAAAGEKQAVAIERLMASSQWSSVPPLQRRVGELRVEYPYLTLNELAELAEPPLSKSALNHRLRRLLALADELPASDGAERAPATGSRTN